MGKCWTCVANREASLQRKGREGERRRGFNERAESERKPGMYMVKAIPRKILLFVLIRNPGNRVPVAYPEKRPGEGVALKIYILVM